MAKYTDQEIAAAVELAADVGIAATRRELGYPSSWATLKRWCDEAGVEIELDQLKSKAAQWNSFYEETELRIAQQDLLARALELMDDPDLTPAELDKLASTMKRATDSIQMLRGKATSRTAVEDTTDAEALKLYDEFQKSRAEGQ
ncbi:hypothetical protein GS433_18860 [Rhodococcus hoagii]|uniref:hypothetical protein n=1 Tax=Rhodococcus hoagii TaxID=43767 RepID=UPI0007CD8475|nr:hypothetical protein [Prescottella equi]MBM4536454.1 hypothetical protein [Prescottella equi]NKR85491.1 hypothetical protein [Prescottella equi]ORJ95016.1 hypothetical protein A6F56_18985 [Prescottella equi]ORL06736.1 hypothetical protein A6I84_17275 [Prescottella equi]ORL73773.1 hypothetical protein A5N75_17875 [Prescottella equi]